MICDINKKLHKIDKANFDGSSSLSYVDKRPVIVDGNTYKAFILESQMHMIEEYKNTHFDDIAEDDILVSFGSPRRMENVIFTNISNESRENILIVARGAEMQCAASLISTVCESFRLQDGVVKVWAYSKNRIYKTYKDTVFSKYEIFEGIEDICSAIKELKNSILERRNSNEVIILLGMEQICSDFEFIDFGVVKKSASTKKMENYSKYEAKTDDEIAKTNETINFNLAFEKKYNVNALEERLMDEGKSEEEIDSEIAKLVNEFAKEYYADIEAATEKSQDAKDDSDAEIISAITNDEPDAEIISSAYNALEDFKYVIKQGSRFGYHFVFCVNNMSDFKSARIGSDAFRHRLAFQTTADDSSELFGNRVASKLPEHICQYSNQLDQYSLRPYIHKGISWDGWIIDEDGKTTNI
jgi:hypothetical protein